MSRKLDWLMLAAAWVVLNIFCLNINVNTDTSFSLRYLTSLYDIQPSLLVVQPGSRIFPDWAYSALVVPFTEQPLLWSRLMIAINTLMLAWSVHYLSRTLNLNHQQATHATVLALLITPALYVLHPNVHIYFIHSPGIHGFYIPYILFCLAWSLQLLSGSSTWGSWQSWLYVLILSWCVSSNLAFFLTVVPAISAVALWQIMVRQIRAQEILRWLALTVLGLLLAWAWTHMFASLDAISLKSLDNPLFRLNLFEWLQNNNRYLFQITDRVISGYAAEIMVVSVAVSILVLLRHMALGLNLPLTWLNIIFICWLLVFFTAMWALDKENIRLTPFLLLASPLILLLNAISLFQMAHRYSFQLAGVMFVVASVATWTQYDSSRPYVQNHEVKSLLEELLADGTINQHGISDYWIANMSDMQPFSMAPVLANGQPHAFASDVLAIWQWNDQQPQRKHMTFVVNRCNPNNKCLLDMAAIKEKYGPWDQSHERIIQNKTFTVYTYADGINTNHLYQGMKRLIHNFKPDTPYFQSEAGH